MHDRPKKDPVGPAALLSPRFRFWGISELLAVYALGLPVLGASIAWIASLHGWGSVNEELPKLPTQPSKEGTPKSRFIVIVTLPATLVLFGYGLWFIFARSENVAIDLLETAAARYGIAGLFTGIGEAVVLWRGAGKAALAMDQFSRILVLLVMVEVVALLGYMVALFGGQAAKAVSDPGLIRSRLQLGGSMMALGSIGAPLTAGLSVSIYDFGTVQAWKKGILAGLAGLGFALFLSMVAVSTLANP